MYVKVNMFIDIIRFVIILGLGIIIDYYITVVLSTAY